jgi:GGDEF domain-containing protein
MIDEAEPAAEERDRAAEGRDRAADERDRVAEEREGAPSGSLRRARAGGRWPREIARARRSDGRLVLAFVDVDGLKPINDVQGHAVGDALLRDAAVALRTALRSYDLVVRYGGDEFLCALAGTDVEGAQRRFDEVARLWRNGPREPLRSIAIPGAHPD